MAAKGVANLEVLDRDPDPCGGFLIAKMVPSRWLDGIDNESVGCNRDEDVFIRPHRLRDSGESCHLLGPAYRKGTKAPLIFGIGDSPGPYANNPRSSLSPSTTTRAAARPQIPPTTLPVPL